MINNFLLRQIQLCIDKSYFFQYAQLNKYKFRRSDWMAYSTNSFNMGRSMNLSSAMSRATSINQNSDNFNYESRVRRNQSSIRQIQKVGLKAGFPQFQNDIKTPQISDFINKQQKGNVLTPSPPVIRNELQNIMYKGVKKFNNKYQYIWILIVQQNHPAIQIFNQVYQFQKMSNINHVLQNIIIPEDFKKINYFIKEGVSIKILSDNFSYNKFLKHYLELPANRTDKIMQVYIEGQKGILSNNKIKSIDDLKQFIEEQVKIDVENSRKDKPYYNFVHSNSGPELFTRRSIMKNCILTKPRQQLVENDINFVKLLHKFNRQQQEKKHKQARKNGINVQQKIEQANRRYDKWQGLIKQYQQKSRQSLEQFHPLEQQSDRVKQMIYNQMICQYSIQSPVYYVVNNTIRFSTNNQNARPLSTFIRHLYDGIKYYFTNNHRMHINLDHVYRGARISHIQQRSLVEKRYLRNLGFMSTSKSKNVAESFLVKGKMATHGEDQQGVLIVIKISPLASQLDYLADQEGFYSIDTIPQVRNKVKLVAAEQQVLFNPLNIFQIQKWNNTAKVLTLKYAPHLQILQKKREKLPLTQQQQELLRGISKLRQTYFDKGQQLLEEGDPSGAVKYYEQSNDSGSQLSFAQKSNYIKGLMEVGDIEKMESLLKIQLQAQKNAEKQIISSSITSIQKLADSVQSISLLQQTNNFVQADEKAQNLVQESAKKSIDMPSQETLLIQMKAYIQLSKVKHGVSETLGSINYSVQGLKIIDQMAHVNFCYRLWQIGNDLKKLPRSKLDINEKLTPNLLYILNQSKLLNLRVEQEKKVVLDKLKQIRQNSKDNQIVDSIKNNNKIKQAHQNAQKILSQYFYKTRAKRNDFQNFQQKFVYASWQLHTVKLKSSQQITKKEYAELKKRMKQLEQDLFMVREDYMVLFQNQINAYQVLYKNIYKTSIDVSPCLESYHKNLYYRYEIFINCWLQHQGYTLEAAEFYWKYADILYEFSQIIERPKNKDRSFRTDAQKLANIKIQKAQSIIQQIQKKQNKITGNAKTYTFQKNQINRTMSRYFKSKTIDKQQARKLSIIKTQSYKAQNTISSFQQNIEKGNDFSKLVSLLDSNKQLCQSDPNINKSTFQLKIACQKIQVLNQSSNILMDNSSYIQRLRSCKAQYQNVINTIQKYNQQEIMQRNLNMAQLNLLMSENQFRLGIISNAKNYLKQSNQCLKKVLKIDQLEQKDKIHQINKQKLLLGNSTFIGCKRLEAHIIAFFGSLQDKKLFYSQLVKLKDKMFETMHEPLNEADMNQSLGLIASNMLMLHKEISFNEASRYYLDAIALRQKLLGPYNKFIARDYSLIVKMISVDYVKSQYYKQIQKYYEQAVKIYGRIDMSLESTIILHRMQLRSTFLMFTFNNEQACNFILEDLEHFQKCPNKQMALETAQQLYRCSRFVAEQDSYRLDGLDWLKYTYEYIKCLEKFVQKISQVSEKERKINLLALKVEVLKKIVAIQLKEEGDDLEQYYKCYNQEKERYNKLKL